MDVIFTRNFSRFIRKRMEKPVKEAEAEMEVILTGKRITRENDGENLATGESFAAVTSRRADDAPLISKKPRRRVAIHKNQEAGN